MQIDSCMLLIGRLTAIMHSSTQQLNLFSLSLIPFLQQKQIMIFFITNYNINASNLFPSKYYNNIIIKMQSDKITQYSQLIPKIKARVRQLKNRSNKKVFRINQVSDPAMTLVSASEAADNRSFNRNNLIKIKTYFETIVLAQAKMDIMSSNNNFKEMYMTCRKQIIEKLDKIESVMIKLQEKTQGGAVKFFEEFGNGGFSDDNKLFEELEKLVALLTLNKQNSPNNELFEHMKKYLNSETQKIVENLNSVFGKISRKLEQMSIVLFANSTIVKSNEHELISGWVKDQVGAPKRFETLLNSKDHGFEQQTFHSRCDGKGPTILVVETTSGKRFGGYANSSWHNMDGVYIVDEKCFIFSLDLKEKYLHKPGTQSSMYGSSSYGPAFGNGHDFYLSDNSNSNNSSYCYPNNTYNCGSRTCNDITGSKNFTVKNYEVYQVKQCQCNICSNTTMS